MKKALITGIAGFAGSHLAELLLSQKISVCGFFLSSHPTGNLKQIKAQIKVVACDLQNTKAVEKEVRLINPDYVFHLAAFSSPADSFKNPKETLQNNIFGQINLLESLVKIRSKAKILVIGSADEYGQIDEKYLPADENTPLKPNSPYAVSKVAQDMLGLQFFLHHKLHIVRVRPFNHIGPRQSVNFVVSAFASRIVSLEKQGKGTMKVGNLNSFRDFTDVRDMVRAYLLALDSGIPGEVYNIGCGKPIQIRKILDMLLSLSSAKIKIEKDPSLLRPVEIEKIYCNFDKFKKQTGWQPRIPLLKTLSDTIEYERSKLKFEARSTKH